MKTLKLVICLLAVTISVACSKKKDGNSAAGVAPHENGYNGYGQGYYPGQQMMPGYQMPTQGNCQGPSQMFPDLGSYCAWLATDGERMCDPMMVRQNFMQYCQSFATRYNYCVQEVRSGCYGTTQGCSIKVNNVWERYSQHSRRDQRTSKPYKQSNPGQIIDQPNDNYPNDDYPVIPVCDVNPSADCKKKNPKKSQLICKLPGDSSQEENYVYTLEEYKSLACENKVAQNNNNRRLNRPTSTVKSKATVSELAPMIVNGKYEAATQVQPQSEVLVHESKHEVTTAVATKTETKNSDMNNSQCLNIQEIHEYILDDKNSLSSSAEYYQAELLDKNLSKNFVNAWKLAMKPILNRYSVSVYTSVSALSAIGAHVEQNNKTSQVRMAANLGKIVSCDSGKQMILKFDNEVGVQEMIFTQNGLDKSDSEFEVTETTRGVFKYGNETGTYLLARYIGVGKNLSESKIQAKVIADMKKKKFTEIDPESIINN